MKSLNRKHKRVRPLLGTFVEIELCANLPQNRLDTLISAGFDAIAHVDHLMSYHRSESDLTRLNQAPVGVWVCLDARTIEVLQASNLLYRRSHGVFDIRCGAALAAAGILSLQAGKLRPATFVNARSLPAEIRGAQARKSGPWLFDLGGIAKGYAVDEAVKTIQKQSRGVRMTGVVNAGGDMRVWGSNSVPAAALIGGQTSWARPMTLRQTAVATSSARSNSLQNQRQSPSAQVKMPSGKLICENRTVTVFADRCLWADALTKVALLSSPALAAQTMYHYRARGLLFQADGRLERAIN